jgi:hypothetical protein
MVIMGMACFVEAWNSKKSGAGLARTVIVGVEAIEFRDKDNDFPRFGA